VKIIGVTGISGSGKTFVTHILGKMYGYTIETDPMVHGLMKKGQPAHMEIAEAFGPDILDNAGEIHRPSLGGIVFGNKEKMAILEAILHPKVAAKTAGLLAEAQREGIYKFAVMDVPLLIESGMHEMCGSVWLITASYEIRLARIMARDNITRETAEKRLASRMGDEALKPYAHIIIENNDDHGELWDKVEAALMTVL